LFSSIVNDYFSQQLDHEEFLIGDFGSGRNAEVPIFFAKEYQNMFSHKVPNSTVYSIDMHTLRLENMFGQFREEGITSKSRVVYAKMETMSSHASFPYEQKEYLKKTPQDMTSLDHQILNEQKLPPACFHLGILNKDILGYLSEYYENDTDMRTSLQAVRDSLKQDGLMIVTQPCVMYRVDNLRILRDNTFHIEDIIDVDLKTGKHSVLDESASMESFSKPNHYSFIVVSSK
jgi:hypothetical protein